MNASRVLVDLLGQLVGIGRLEFGDAAVFENQLGQRIRCGQLLEDIFRGRRLSGRRLAHHRQAELAEQDLLQLLGRVQVERAARFGVRLRLQLQHARRELGALRLEKSPVHQHAGALHAIQHRHERLLDGLVEILQARQRFDLRPKRAMQPQRDVGVFRGIVRGAIHVDLIEGDLLRALARDIFVVNGLDSEILLGRRIHVVAGGHAVEHVGLQHGIVSLPAQRDAVVRKDVRIEFEMMPELRRAPHPRAAA